MAEFAYTAAFTFETGDPVAASFDNLSMLPMIERANAAEFGPIRSILIEVNGREGS